MARWRTFLASNFAANGSQGKGLTNGKLGFEYQLQFFTMLTYSGESSGGKQSVNGDEDPGVVIVVIKAYKNLGGREWCSFQG